MLLTYPTLVWYSLRWYVSRFYNSVFCFYRSVYIVHITQIVKNMNKGAGFALFQGHGSSMMWDTRWADDSDTWVGGFSNFNMFLLFNYRKLPIVVVGGCHNGIFNISYEKAITDSIDDSNYHAYGVPVIMCFSWKLVKHPLGGAITCTGCTGYGIGSWGTPLSLSAELESNFFLALFYFVLDFGES